MLNYKRVKSISESNQTEEQHAWSKRSVHNATLINSGTPALYRLNTEKSYIDGNDRTVRRWTYGQKKRNVQNKVILMVGETGSGKTTLINSMINHLLGVKFEDQEFYQITEEDEEAIDETQSQTRKITVYEAFVEENPTSLTIIETPGYGDTEGFEKDGKISEYLGRLFSHKDGVHYIDAVCFVMKATQNRLSGKELYIFHSVLSLFGRDIENNIVFLLTHSDGLPPTNALNAINTAEIPCRRDENNKPVCFLFNNRQKEEREEQYEQAYRSVWEIGEESMKEFLTLLNEDNRKSVKMTLDVVKERKRLESCVSNLRDQINEKELKTKVLNQIQEALRQNRENSETFKFIVNTVVKEKVPTDDKWWWNRNITSCSVCEENCHEGCWWVSSNLSWCLVMKNNHCTVCTGKCHYSEHIRENKKYVTKTENVIMSLDQLRQENGLTVMDGRIRNVSESKTEIEEKLIRDLEKIKNEKSNLLQEAYKTAMILSKIALKADSAFSLQHLEFLIPRLKEERKDEWVKNLEDLRKAGEEKRNKGALEQMKGYLASKTKSSHM
ncbi:uncharacterized protein [Pseudorasbora parva]|uniref:uncharacterized protein n=1 Tax=Pseudorasbora parva TaxID=51549 RepID=UPI00351F5D89